jgi:hypothetical protein
MAKTFLFILPIVSKILRSVYLSVLARNPPFQNLLTHFPPSKMKNKLSKEVCHEL